MNLSTTLDLVPKGKLNNEGKNSEVYIMYDPQLSTDLIVKCIPKNFFSDADKFFEESSILYAVEHPNIVRIQHSSTDADNIYLSMPYYQNGSVHSLINSRYLTVSEIAYLSLGFLSALHFVHTKGLIHFDIKPTNILINDNGQALLSDFGLSKYVNDYGLSSPDKIYTFHAPPEWLKSSLLSNKSDIYQSGMTLYRMCYGNDVFNAQRNSYKNKADLEKAIVSGTFPNKKYYLPHIPRKMRNIIRKALEINPDKRYKTAVDMSNDISLIDNSVDILYAHDKNTCSDMWEYSSSSTHVVRVTLQKVGSNWRTIGERIRKSDGKVTRVNNFCKSDYPTRESAFIDLERGFSDL